MEADLRDPKKSKNLRNAQLNREKSYDEVKVSSEKAKQQMKEWLS